ncbi:transcription termination factor 5, mitochondrial [Linepithema humile]|uniref:transcription termination factor 5, mitochondrial n=1 Tax=Linepithema humile TaxID=83485 RepID=UPI0006239658|nr:PREDICTED: uncharacterized protein LOC105667736 [Linepithema humile]XP_012215133.1 PREDICTED: uncharacterized protein LOC105667736 [Linepithema humile]XP_012215134.1 PREDICTED: uncharacterized protein LOC105667736 [Linepithema humile]
MRFNNRNLIRTSLFYFLKKKEFQNILMKNLGLNSTDVEEILDVNKNILNLSRHRIIKNCMTFEKYNVNVKPLINFPYCLKMKEFYLEHRINVLKDIGVSELNSFLVGKLYTLSNKHVSIFKKKINLPIEQNIAKNIFGRLGEEVPNEISQLESSDELTMNQYYKACLLYCKNRIFDLPYLDDKVLLHSLNTHFKSISMIAETLKVLRIDLDYDEKMIKMNPYIINASADNIRMLLNNFTDIYGIPISTLLRKHPYMLFQDADNIKRLLASLKRYKIPDEYVKKYMKFLKMDNYTFLERIERLKQHPDVNLRIWYMYPRILKILEHVNMMDHRIKYLHFMNCAKWAVPHTVLSTKSIIDRFVQNDSNIIISKKPVKYILKMELGMDICDQLCRHQHWKTVTLVDIQKMLKYLKRHFTISEIRQNIHIILYAQSRVEKILADLKQQYSESTQYSFTNGQYLALCLYILEKDTHFTGDGIWNNGHNAEQKFSHPLKDESVAERIDNDDINNNLNIKDDDDDHNHFDDRNETSSVTK